MPSRRDSRLWYKQTKPDEAGTIISQLSDRFAALNVSRQEHARKMASMYEGIELTGLDGDCYNEIVPVFYDGAPLASNRAQAVVDTLQAKLVALDEPRSQYVVTDGTYEQKRQAVWLDRFIEGQYYQKQGQFSTLWDLWRHAFLIAAAATGTVAVKIFPDFNSRRICAEIHNGLDMWIDPQEVRYGSPLTFGEDTWMDAEPLLDEYSRSDTKTKAILAARDTPKKSNKQGDDNKNDNLQVKVSECWRIRGDSDDKGKYARVVGSCALEFEDYPYKTPPFVFYHFRRRLSGFWGASATEQFYQSVVRENQCLARMDEAEARMQTVIQYYDPNSVPAGQQLSVPKHVVLIPYDASQGAPPPPVVPQWYPQQAPELMRIHAQNTHDASGVAQMQVTGQAQQGLTAAVAIRTVLSLLNERFAPRQRDIVQAIAVDSGTLIARAAKELYERFGSFDSAWHGKGFIKTLPGAECLSLPDEIYTVQARPVSEKKNSPEDRLQLAQELVSQGLITGGHWLGILRHMDTLGATRAFQSAERWCEKLFDKFRLAPDSEMRKPGFYEPPSRYEDLDYLMALGLDAYRTACVDEVPDNRRQFFLRFLADCDRAITQRDQRRQQMGLPPAGATMTGGAQQATPAPSAG